MSRPKSSWGEIFTAVGAISAADGAQRAAGELRGLRLTQEQTLRTVQAQAAWERQRREADDRQREAVRKLKDLLFEFSEHLPAAKQVIENLLPDVHTAAALFQKSRLQEHAAAWSLKREFLESYEDKRLLTNCLDVIRSIGESIENCSPNKQLSLDKLEAILNSRRSEANNWKQVSCAAQNAIEQLAPSINNFSGRGPEDFLNAVEGLRRATALARRQLDLVKDGQRRFGEILDFVRSHPNITDIWPEASQASPSSIEDVLRTGRSLIMQAEQLAGKWTREVDTFKALKVSFSAARYEDFLEHLQECAPYVKELPEVRYWTDSAVRRMRRASDLYRTARDAEVRGNWQEALNSVRQAKAVPCSKRQLPVFDEMELAALKGLLPVRLGWILGACTGLFVLLFWLWPAQWLLFIEVIMLTSAIPVMTLVCQIIAAIRRQSVGRTP